MAERTTREDATPEASRSDEWTARIVAAMRARDRAATWLGIDVLDVRAGYAQCAMSVTESMLNGHDVAHGGLIFTLADTAFAYACNARNDVNLALDCSISFATPARLGERLLAICQERTRGKRTGIYDVTVTGTDGRTIAVFRGTSYQINATILPGEAP
jgi:acyl-CoA thioesterase